MNNPMKTQLFTLSLFIVRNVLLLSLFGTQFVLNSQTLSERGVTVISLAPPVVVPAKNITVSQALRFGEQVEPRPDLLAARTDIPVITAKQPIMFDHDLLR